MEAAKRSVPNDASAGFPALRLRLARAFLRESAEMLLRPLPSWEGMAGSHRESYVCRASRSLEALEAWGPIGECAAARGVDAGRVR